MAFALSALIISFILDPFVLRIIQLFQHQFFRNIAVFLSLENFLIALVFMVFTVLLVKNKKQGLNFVVAILLTFLASFVIKLLVARERPLGFELFTFGLKDYSFPSSHAAIAFCLFVFLYHGFKKQKHIWLSLAVLISLSRIYISAHYFSDIVAGALLGCAIGLLFAKK